MTFALPATNLSAKKSKSPEPLSPKRALLYLKAETRWLRSSCAQPLSTTSTLQTGAQAMKKILPMLVGSLLLASVAGLAQAQSNSRKLYYDYQPAPPAVRKPAKHKLSKRKPAKRKSGKPPHAAVKRGRPGVRFWLAQHQAGQTVVVSPKVVFRAGDRVKFHFTANYPAYVVVFNEGSSGRPRLLYPFAGQAKRVKPNVTQAIPHGNAWFKFDTTPGVERLTVLMSNRPFVDLDRLLTRFKTRGNEHSLAAVALVEDDAPASSGSRDLMLDFAGNEGFALASEEALDKVKIFRFALKHR
jgi:hypothetical protein